MGFSLNWPQNYIDQRNYIDSFLDAFRETVINQESVFSYKATEPTDSDFQNLFNSQVGQNVSLAPGVFCFWFDSLNNVIQEVFGRFDNQLSLRKIVPNENRIVDVLHYTRIYQDQTIASPHTMTFSNPGNYESLMLFSSVFCNRAGVQANLGFFRFNNGAATAYYHSGYVFNSLSFNAGASFIVRNGTTLPPSSTSVNTHPANDSDRAYHADIFMFMHNLNDAGTRVNGQIRSHILYGALGTPPAVIAQLQDRYLHFYRDADPQMSAWTAPHINYIDNNAASFIANSYWLVLGFKEKNYD